MKYYSTNKKAPMATLHEAVVKGLAGDRGLYMPESIKQLPQSFFDNIQDMSFQDIAFTVAQAFFGEDIPDADLRRIVDDTLAFDCPVARVTDNIYSLELFHGPTLAFKDVGARFMARLLQYFIRQEGREQVNVLVCVCGLRGHPTPVEVRTDVQEPVPFRVYHQGMEPDDVKEYDEVSCVGGSYGMLRLQEFMQEFMKIK